MQEPDEPLKAIKNAFVTAQGLYMYTYGLADWFQGSGGFEIGLHLAPQKAFRLSKATPNTSTDLRLPEVQFWSPMDAFDHPQHLIGSNPIFCTSVVMMIFC